MASIQHSKFRNTGILFELLVRQVTADTLNGKENSPAVKIIRKYFSPQTELGKELVLYRALHEASKLSEPRALKFLDMVLEQCRRLDNKKLSEQKYHLVKEIKDTYPLKDFLSSKIPQYKLYASVYKTFLSEVAPEQIDASDIQEMAQARFTIVEHITGKVVAPDTKTEPLIETYKAQQEDLRLLTFRLMTEKFNDKYAGLEEKQKVLLREYVNNISNTNSLRAYVNREVPSVKSELERLRTYVPNKITRIKLHEVISQLNNITKGQTVRDSQITALMIAYQLIVELKSVIGGK